MKIRFSIIAAVAALFAAAPSFAGGLQAGPWFLSAGNQEHPFVNMLHASRGLWTDDEGWTNRRLYDEGYIDPETGLPARLPGRAIRSELYLFAHPVDTYAGDWVLTWNTGEGPEAAEIRAIGVIDVTENMPGRIEFTVDPQRRGYEFVRVEIEELDAPLTDLKLYRAEHEAVIAAGAILRPEFLQQLNRYAAIRDMDWMRAATGDIRAASDNSPPSKLFWGDLATAVADNEARPATRGLPIEMSVRAAVEAGTALWHVAPLTLGAPRDLEIGAMRWQPVDNRAINDEGVDEILSSPEWDRWASRLVQALEAEDYPLDRPLYLAVGNEVWNWASQYSRTTAYAAHIGRAFPGAGWDIRRGYGVLSGRFAVAMEKALEAAGRGNQSVTYVIESQTAVEITSRDGLREARGFIERSGGKWADWSDKFAVALTTYWGDYPVWRGFLDLKATSDYSPTAADKAAMAAALRAKIEAKGRNAAAAELAAFIENGSAEYFGTAASVVAAWKKHDRWSKTYNARLLGAYEGGAHMKVPPFAEGETDLEAFIFYFLHESEHGAAANLAVQNAVRAAFPDAMLSNYSLGNAPTLADPWHDGSPAAPSAKTESWTPFLRPAGE